MRLKYVVLIVALGAVSLSASGYYYWSTHRPWTTDSPRIQNGLELVSLQKVQDGKKPRISIDLNPDAMMVSPVKGPVEIALFRVPDKDKVDKDPYLRPRNGNLAFYLTSKNEKYITKLRVNGYGSDCSVVGVQMPDACPPDYENGSLVAKIGEKTLGEWKMSRMLLAPKLISDSTPNVSEAKFGGLNVQANVKLQKPGPGVSLFDISFISDQKPTNGDKYKAHIIRCNTTYRSLGFGSSLPIDNRPGLSMSTPLEADTEHNRADIVAKLVRYRTYDERISVKNVHIEPVPMGETTPSVFVASFGKEQHFTTPSGLKLTVSSWGKPSDFSGSAHLCHSFGLRIRSESGFSGLSVPNSSSLRSTGKPAALSFTCDNLSGGGAMSSSSEDGKTMDLQLEVPRGQNNAMDIANLKIVVHRRVDLEEKTVRFVVPILER